MNIGSPIKNLSSFQYLTFVIGDMMSSPMKGSYVYNQREKMRLPEKMSSRIRAQVILVVTVGEGRYHRRKGKDVINVYHRIREEKKRSLFIVITYKRVTLI